MRYFDFLDNELSQEIFFKIPGSIDLQMDHEKLKYALGATLYMPAGREDLSKIILSNKYPEMKSLVLCLEDAIKDDDVESAEISILNSLKTILTEIKCQRFSLSKMPLLFIRIRNSEHLQAFSKQIEPYRTLIHGFVLPKFDESNAQSYIACMDKLNRVQQTPYHFMPILESESIIFSESRHNALKCIRDSLNTCKDSILNIRIGATDFCSHFGIRRGKDVTVYQIQVVRECISDILNFFARSKDGYVVSGPVWEYFPDNRRLLKPLLRATPFNENFGMEGLDYRNKLIEHNLDGLIRETLLDKENGFIGKTVIHPSHLLLVNALYVVTHEEYLDACSILEENQMGGVLKSSYQNKMNEIKPHTYWAKKILQRAEIYGVFNKNHDYVSLLHAQKGGLSEAFRF